MNKKIKIISGIVIVLVIFTSFIAINNNKESTVQTASRVLSNTKIGWGIKREINHIQPDLGTKNKELINKYSGIAMGSTEKKYVYLTFDEGYEAGYTPRILQVLKDNNVKATFFLTAHYVNTSEELVKQMIGERSYSRKPYSKP